MSNWIKLTEDNVPRGNVLLRGIFRFYGETDGVARIVIASYHKKFELESGDEHEDCDYDEETDTYYDPEGWYENLECNEDFGGWLITNCEVTHYQPLPSTDL